MLTMLKTYRVECRNGDERADFPGLDLERATERCEAERAKGRWQTVAIVWEANGRVEVAYGGAARVT